MVGLRRLGYGGRMSRPLRLKFPGALYHVTARGDLQRAIYLDDSDRYAWLDILARMCARYNFVVHGFCQMTNHYHLLIETPDANISAGMRQLNGQYSQYFNRRHQVVGHVFQGRYDAVLVQKESHLRELARYVVLNPVRARMVSDPSGWPWSSYALMIQQAAAPAWLHTEWLLAQFGVSREEAIAAYQRFVLAGIGGESPLKHTRHQLLLGDEQFVRSNRYPQVTNMLDVTRAQRRAQAMSLAEYQQQYGERDLAITQAYLSTAYTMAEIAQYFGVSPRTVSRIVCRTEVGVQPSPCTIGGTYPGG